LKKRISVVDHPGEKMMKELICYCFNYTVEDIKIDFQKNGESTILEKIATEKKFNGCACVNKNPKGR
jgi:hypothetical protein